MPDAPSQGTRLANRTTVPDYEYHVYVMCDRCAHFVDPEEWAYGHVLWTHLDNGEQQLPDGDEKYDHDATPGQARMLVEWRSYRSDLFTKWPDGEIGPNSKHFRDRRGWRV